MSLTLHGVPLSPFVRKVRIVLAEKALPYEINMVVPYVTPQEYSQINPLRKIPALEDGETIICDSAVICDYLEHKKPTTALYPDNPTDRAQALWLEKYADYELAPDSTFKVFFQHIVCPTLKKPSDPAIIQDAVNNLIPPHLDYLENQLNGQQWFVNNTFSIADIAIACQLINLQHAGYPLDGQRWPGLYQHLQQLTQRDSVADMHSAEQQMVEKVKSRFSIGDLPL
ncbi:MAG: glutathione S-transferase family protein [Marinobacterium sp.]|nr:glutathione S-transferase family protein [Marinobacterium sp.]